MIIGRSTSAGASARALARADDDPCELFAAAEGRHFLALLTGAEAPPPRDGWEFSPARILFEQGLHGPGTGDWLFCVGLWVPDADRADFLSWYEDEHLPMLLECAAWQGCRFVEVPAPKGAQFFALHQLADPRALDSPERSRSRTTPWFWRLKRHPWFDEPFTRTLYRRLDAGSAACSIARLAWAMTTSPPELPDHLRPAARGLARAYWEAAARGELRLPRCGACGTVSWPPRAHCPRCGTNAIDWVRACGKGTVHTFTVVRASPDPYFAARVPYVVAMVTLAEGPRIMSNIVGCEAGAVRVGMPVVVSFVSAGEGCAVPLFAPEREP